MNDLAIKMKSTSHRISKDEACSLALTGQGLGGRLFKTGKAGTLAAIEHLGYIQIDTLAVAVRAHHHVLWSRLTNYRENYLAQLAENDKTVFEYWSHAASFLPMKDYRFSLPRKQRYLEGKSHWFEKDKKQIRYVYDRIRAEGPLQSKDFEEAKPGKGMWQWKPAKRALEQLFMEGRLMVSHRQGFQKVYDLTERVLPAGVDTRMPSPEEYAEYLVMQAIRTHGIVSVPEITYLKKETKTSVENVVKKMLKNETLKMVEVDGLNKSTFLMDPNTPLDTRILPGVNILSPFDNLVIQRKRLLQLFDFDFMMECYLPAAKRTFGYFCLPILYNGRFVARFDPKADRDKKIFYIKSIHFEKGFKPSPHFNLSFAKQLTAFAHFNGCEKIMIENASVSWKQAMMKLLSTLQ